MLNSTNVLLVSKKSINMLCKRTILAIVLLVLQACADIVLGHVEPACNYLLPKPHQGCLREESCLQDNS
jgi:hypothetical protein